MNIHTLFDQQSVGILWLYVIPVLPRSSINLLSGPKRIVNTLSVLVFWLSLKVSCILEHALPGPLITCTHIPAGLLVILCPSITTTYGRSALSPPLKSTVCLGS